MSAAIELKEGQWPRRFLWFRILPAVNHSSCVTSADRVVSRLGIRDLPIHRIREHLQVTNNWAPVLNALLSSVALSEDEITVLISIILLRPKQYPNNAKLRQIAGIRYRSLLKALDSLVARRILFFDVWHYGKLPEEKKNIWHISSPCFWRIDGWPSSSFNSSGKIDPENWIPKRLYSAPDVRIDEYTDEAVASEEYVKAPRSLGGEVEPKLSNSAKRIWLYLASLPSSSHPTAEQLARAVRITKPTALSGLRMLSQYGMIVRHDYRHSRICPPLERTYHIVNPSYWDSSASSWYDEPEVSIAYTPEIISYIAQGKNGKYTGSNRETHSVKTGNALGKNGKRTGTNRETHTVKTGNVLGKNGKCTGTNREIGGELEPLSEGGFQNFSGPCEKDPREKDPSEKISDEEEDLLGGLPIYREPGRPSYLVTKLVKNYVEYPFQDKKTLNVFPVPLNEWIADFMTRSKRDLGTLSAGYEETVQFCQFVRDRFGGRNYHPRDSVFKMMEAVWEQHKAAAAEAATESTELQSSDTAAESQNPALECEKTAHHSYSTETVFQSPALEILLSVPVEAEPEHLPAISSPQAQLIEMPVPSDQKPENILPTDPDRQQWLVARVYATSRPSQRRDMDAMWAKKPGRIVPMLRFFSEMEYVNKALVDSAQAELDALGILRKSDIPPLPWTDSGELAPMMAPAPAPKQLAGDGTLPLPLTRDRLKRALRKLLNREPNVRLRFEIDAWFMAIADDGEFHAQICNKFGSDQVKEVLDGNH